MLTFDSEYAKMLTYHLGFFPARPQGASLLV